MDFVRYVQQEWSVLSAAPAAFVMLVVIAFAAAFFVVQWASQSRYDTQAERLEKAKDEISVLDRRLAQKDTQLADYRQRVLGSDPHKQTAFSSLTNAQLKEKALALAADALKMMHDRNANEVEHRAWFERPDWDQLDQAKQTEAFQEHGRAASARTDAFMSDFERNYKVEAIALRDELLTRLPPNIKRSQFISYENAVNPLVAENVVNDLKLLAISLPTWPRARMLRSRRAFNRAGFGAFLPLDNLEFNRLSLLE
jgi:hypothetical protein